jgi:hypothetical protein
MTCVRARLAFAVNGVGLAGFADDDEGPAAGCLDDPGDGVREPRHRIAIEHLSVFEFAKRCT